MDFVRLILEGISNQRRFVNCPSPIGAAEHPTSTDHRPANSAYWITMKLGAVYRGESQLSFALLFMPIRVFSEKRTIPNFRCMSGGGTSKLQGGAIRIDSGSLSIKDSTFESNEANAVSLDHSAFVLRTL